MNAPRSSLHWGGFSKEPLVAEGEIKRITLFFLMLLLLIFPLFSTDGKKDEITIRHQFQNKLTIVPDIMLRGYDPITVFFPSA